MTIGDVFFKMFWETAFILLATVAISWLGLYLYERNRK